MQRILAAAAALALFATGAAHSQERADPWLYYIETLPDLQPDAMTIASYSKSEPWMDYAASVFAGNCVLCHGAEGGGAVRVVSLVMESSSSLTGEAVGAETMFRTSTE